MKSVFAFSALFLSATTWAASPPDELPASIQRGQLVYVNNCASCHMADGAGVAGVFPPLAKSDYLMADKLRSVRIAMHGLQGQITVNGATYGAIPMPDPGLTDAQIVDVLNYVRNNWGNKGEAVTLPEVQKARAMK